MEVSFKRRRLAILASGAIVALGLGLSGTPATAGDAGDMWKSHPHFGAAIGNSSIGVFFGHRSIGAPTRQLRDHRHRHLDRRQHLGIHGHVDRRFGRHDGHRFARSRHDRGRGFHEGRGGRFYDGFASRGFDHRGGRANHRSPDDFRGIMRR